MTDAEEALALAAARRHLHARRWPAVQALVQRWESRRPHSPNVLALQAHICLSQGRHEAARPLLEAAVAMTPTSAFAYATLAQFYLAQNKRAEALVALRRALQLEPGEVDTSLTLVGLLLETKELEEVARLLQEALDCHPQDVRVWSVWAEYGLMRNQLEAAEAALQKAQTIDPYHAPTRMVKSLLMQQVGRLEDAQRDCEFALMLDPENSFYWVSLGKIMLLRAQGASDRQVLLLDAEKVMRQVTALQPGDAMPHLVLAIVLRMQARWAESLQLHAEVVRQQPKEIDPLLELLITQRLAGHLASALLTAQRARGLDPSNARVLLAVQELKQWEGDWAGAFVATEDFLTQQKRASDASAKLLPMAEITKQEVVWMVPQAQSALLLVRYAQALSQLQVRVVVVTDPLWHNLLRRVPGISELMSWQDLGVSQTVEPMARWPYLLGMDTADKLWQGPYVTPDVAQVNRVRANWGNSHGLLSIGVNFGASPALEVVRALAAVAIEMNAVLVVFDARDEVMSHLAGVAVYQPRVSDLSELPEWLAALDVLVSVDSALAHLAGAMGLSAHILLSWAHEPLWGVDEQTPWYPNLHCYRERLPQDWSFALVELRRTLLKRPTAEVPT